MSSTEPKVLTVTDAVSANPDLYNAMRDRDSAANYVCELMAHGKNYRQAHAKWKQIAHRVKMEYMKACASAATVATSEDAGEDVADVIEAEEETGAEPEEGES